MIMSEDGQKPGSADERKSALLIGVVGVCASGKSTLIEGLETHGYHARHIAQEHSYVQDMWKRITNPDVLIFLDASYETTIARRRLGWTEPEWMEEQQRLAHAREHADLLIDTDPIDANAVLSQALAFLVQLGNDSSSASHQ